MEAAVVIDNGTGYTKLGYSGNSEPQFIFPTALAHQGRSGTTAGIPSSLSSSMHQLSVKRQSTDDDGDYFFGNDALDIVHSNKTYGISYPVRYGVVDNWDHMERLWSYCLYNRLRADPREHAIVLTESPFNTPENRECMVEVMFENFQVPRLFIGVQAVLAMTASLVASSQLSTENSAASSLSMTGTVVDSGDGVTHIIPVADGFVIGSAIKTIPIAGKQISLFIQQMLRDREPNFPSEDSLVLAKLVKEKYCYLSQDMMEEQLKFDQDIASHLSQFSTFLPSTGKSYSCEIGYEKFLAPELFFNPEMANLNDPTFSLPFAVHQVVQSCPIDNRRSLYQNIVLAGGSTMFKDFGPRLQRDISQIVDKSVNISTTNPIKVNVVSHKNQRHAVWNGGSLIASSGGFHRLCHTKQEYEEHGSYFCRNPKKL